MATEALGNEKQREKDKEKEKEKRTKPCSNCKRAKVKCKYTDDLPCERCLKTGLAASCQFVQRLPSIQYVSDPLAHVSAHDIGNLNQPDRRDPAFSRVHFDPLPSMLRLSPYAVPPPALQYGSSAALRSAPTSPPPMTADREWKLQIESRIDSFDTKLSDLVDILRTNQQAMLRQNLQEHLRSDPLSSYHPYDHEDYNDNHEPGHGQKRVAGSAKEQSTYKRRQIQQTARKSCQLVTKKEARELLAYFDDHISPQLFGFDICSLDFDSIYSSCPILMCAICAIACIHHPHLAGKAAALRAELKRLCSAVMFESKPRTKDEAFTTIIALILCSFWWSDNQTLTGLALQLAKEFRFNNPNASDKRHLKLWYLLYILDGQQSLTYNRQRLVETDDDSIKQCRALLPETPASKQLDNDPEAEKFRNPYPYREPRSHSLSDMRLVSQVEYNLALSEAFRGNAWELLVPSAFGIPSRSNLELDKWMVSWTVLLATGNHGAVWSSKSTLIYYNFAKIHLNSQAMRRLKAIPINHDETFPKWKESKIKTLEPNTGASNSNTEEANASFPKHQKDKNNRSGESKHGKEESYSSEESSDDENDFIINTNLASQDDPALGATIAVGAARTVLNLVVNDNDILQNLRYVPVHIHIMLYYAALLLIKESVPALNCGQNLGPSSDQVQIAIDNLRIVKTLQRKIDANFPIDASFGRQLVQSLDELVEDNIVETTKAIDLLPASSESKSLQRSLGAVTCSNADANIIDKGREIKDKIYAWPGSDHGHP